MPWSHELSRKKILSCPFSRLHGPHWMNIPSKDYGFEQVLLFFCTHNFFLKFFRSVNFQLKSYIKLLKIFHRFCDIRRGEDVIEIKFWKMFFVCFWERFTSDESLRSRCWVYCISQWCWGLPWAFFWKQLLYELWFKELRILVQVLRVSSWRRWFR